MIIEGHGVYPQNMKSDTEEIEEGHDSKFPTFPPISSYHDHD